jgi:hypothetical protein
MPGGQAWGYGDPGLALYDQWDYIQGNFSLGSKGEGVFLYCIDGAGQQRPLLAFSYGAILAADGQEEYNEQETSFPEQLGEIGLQHIIPHKNNILFNSSAPNADADETTIEALKVAVRDPANWVGSDSSRYALAGSPQNSGTGIGGYRTVVLCISIVTSCLITMFI